MAEGQDHNLGAAGKNPPVRLFISYSHQDEEYRKSLVENLALLRRQGIIEDWHDRMIEAGDDWSNEISSALANSRIVILLISSSFINSDYCFGNEMEQALKMHEQNQAKVIPILIRQCDWKSAPFGSLQALPRDARPVKSWPDQDEAWTDVVNGLRRVIARLSGIPEVATPPKTSVGSTRDEFQENFTSEILQRLNSGQDLKNSVEKFEQNSLNQGDPKMMQNQFDRHIHKIDFVKLGQLLARGEMDIQNGHYFVKCCLFVDYEKMGAEFGVKKIEEKLDSLGCGIRKIEIATVGGDINSDIILKRLIDEFGLEVSPSDVHVDNITDQICRTFHQGRQLLINIHDCHKLNTEDWSWIQKEFWTPLLKKIDQLTVEERESISVLVLLLTEMSIEHVRFDEWCEYSPDDEKSHTIITRVPLSNWTQDDIRRWINNCFPSFSSKFEKQKLTEKIEEIYEETVGMPELVCKRLKKMIVGSDYAN